MDFLVCNKVFARLSLPGCELWHLFGKYGKDVSFLRNLCELYSGMPGQATETDLLQLKERGVSSNVLTKRTVKTHYTVMHRQMRR